MNPSDKDPPNPILAAAVGIMDAIAPGGIEDPEKALRDLIPRLRFLVIQPVEKPTNLQLEALRFQVRGTSLVQIRKALQTGELRLGPVPCDFAEQAIIPRLAQLGLSVSLQKLTQAEKAQHLRSIGDEKK